MVVASATASAVLAVGGVVGAIGYEYVHLNGNITTDGDLDSLKNRPYEPSSGPALNILLLGSQTRDGQAGQFGNSDSTGSFGGTTGTDNSDTSMLLHVAGDRKHAMVVSIPRDTMVARPQCASRDGATIIDASQRAMFDTAMSLGGPLCAAATVEQMWNVRVDDFIRLDFNGFRSIVSYLGGVQVCIPAPGINDPYSHLSLPAGLHVVTGDEALAFVRDRHGIGDGSDLGRIKMQQMFLSSLITKVESDGTLQDPDKLVALADVATKSITTDAGLGSVTQLLDLADALRGLKPHTITFVTMPTVYDAIDPNRVDPGPGSDALWQMVRNDQWLDGSLAAASAAADSSGSQPSGAADAASQPSAAAPDAAGAPPTVAPVTVPSDTPLPTSEVPTNLQTRPADQDLCTGLPTPNPNP